MYFSCQRMMLICDIRSGFTKRLLNNVVDSINNGATFNSYAEQLKRTYHHQYHLKFEALVAAQLDVKRSNSGMKTSF